MNVRNLIAEKIEVCACDSVVIIWCIILAVTDFALHALQPRETTKSHVVLLCIGGLG